MIALLYNIIKKNPYYLSIACLFSVIERIIKTVFIIQTIDTMLLSKSTLTSNDIKYAFQCTSLLSLRYLFAANRHVYAYKASIATRNTIIQYYYIKWLENPMFHTKNYNYTTFLNNIADKIKELVSRIAIDLIPGIISIIVGSYTLITILDYPVGIYCILYIMLIEYIYNNISKKYSIQKEKLSITESTMSAKVFFIATDSLAHRETVHIYDRLTHELKRFKYALVSLFNKEIELIKLQNYQDSFLHWMVHLINGGILWMTRGSLATNSQLILLLYNVSEIRNGIHELRIFNNYKKITIQLLATLNETLCNKNIINQSKYTSNTIELQNVYFSFDSKMIFKNLSISFEPGSITALLGSNGAGKTTLFRLLLQEYGIDSGNILIPDRKNVLLCEQNPQLFLHESIGYNVAYGCNEILERTIDLDGNNIEDDFMNYGDSVQKAIKMMEIENLNIKTLSGGEKQKISIARVLAKAIESPKKIDLLLLDEWDSALDYKSRKITYKAIQYIRKITACTTIFITHNISNEYNYDDCNAIILDNGNVIDSGSFNMVWDKYINFS